MHINIMACLIFATTFFYDREEELKVFHFCYQHETNYDGTSWLFLYSNNLYVIIRWQAWSIFNVHEMRAIINDNVRVRSYLIVSKFWALFTTVVSHPKKKYFSINFITNFILLSRRIKFLIKFKGIVVVWGVSR